MNTQVWRAVGCLALTAAALGAAPSAHAESSFSALSSALAVDVTVANDDFPLVPVVEAAGPSAGTSLDSTGQGTAFASDPYPGYTVAELPGTAAGLTGLPVPPYPLFVATTSDDEPADYSKPGLELHASCRSSSGAGCRASSLAGSDPATAQVHAAVAQPSDDEVVASAQADIQDLALPGGVSLTGMHTSATVTLKDGRLTRRSELMVSRLEVGATQAFSISNGSVVVAGTGIPVPFDALAAALKSAGVEAELFAASSSSSGVVAPVLRLRTVLPGAPAVLSRPTTVVYTLGGADASISLGAFRPSGTSSEPVATGQEPPPTSGGVSGPPPVEAAAPVGVPTAAIPATAGGTAAAPQVAQAVGASSPVAPFDVSDIYLALVLCGVVWFGATQAIRIFGVRFRWT